MIDEYGRINTKSQAIREFKTEQMAYLLNDININPEKYPSNYEDWLKWLDEVSRDSVEKL